jgi:hypothetical protein
MAISGLSRWFSIFTASASVAFDESASTVPSMATSVNRNPVSLPN